MFQKNETVIWRRMEISRTLGSSHFFVWSTFMTDSRTFLLFLPSCSNFLSSRWKNSFFSNIYSWWFFIFHNFSLSYQTHYSSNKTSKSLLNHFFFFSLSYFFCRTLRRKVLSSSLKFVDRKNFQTESNVWKNSSDEKFSEDKEWTEQVWEQEEKERKWKKEEKQRERRENRNLETETSEEKRKEKREEERKRR